MMDGRAERARPALTASLHEEEDEMVEEQFQFEGMSVHYYRLGQGKPLLLLHGSGPGASSIGNWRAVLEPLAQRFEVFAMDLIGFGKSARKPQTPYFDFGLWVRQAEAMLARIGAPKVGVVAHSLAASLALTLASRSEQIGALLTTGAMGAPFELNEATRRTWTCPRNREELVLALKGLIHDTSKIDEAYLQAREAVLFSPGYAEYFDTMFGGDQRQYIQAAQLAPELLARVACPVLMLHGRHDLGFPADCTRTIAAMLADVDVCYLDRCSHSVAVERSTTFVALANDFFEHRL